MSDTTQDDLDLVYYEGVRKKVVQNITSKGIPSDPEMLNILLKAADGGSKIILTKKRIQADQEETKTRSDQLGVVQEMLKLVPTAKQQLERTAALPVIEATAPLPGETSVGTKELFYKDIMKLPAP